MSLELPVVDRWEPVRTLKNDPKTRDIPIIGMSAYAQRASASRPLPRAATSSMSNRSSSSRCSPPFGVSSRTRNDNLLCCSGWGRHPGKRTETFAKLVVEVRDARTFYPIWGVGFLNLIQKILAGLG